MWELLVGDPKVSGEARFDLQLYKANVDPSERYVLSLPGSARYRLHPGGSGYANWCWRATGPSAG